MNGGNTGIVDNRGMDCWRGGMLIVLVVWWTAFQKLGHSFLALPADDRLSMIDCRWDVYVCVVCVIVLQPVSALAPAEEDR